MLAWTADGLTASRALLGVALAFLVARGRFEPAAVALSVAWVTDFLDGRVARAASGSTRLGEWDMPADTAVGVGVLVGLGAGGYLPAPIVVAVLLVFGGGFVLLRNDALGMALQAVSYGAFLWHAWTKGAPTRWVPLVTTGAIAILDRRRFTGVVLPQFFAGAGDVLRLRRSSGFRLPEDRDSSQRSPGAPSS
jgi:phosphatidylserine synthase